MNSLYVWHWLLLERHIVEGAPSVKASEQTSPSAVWLIGSWSHHLSYTPPDLHTSLLRRASTFRERAKYVVTTPFVLCKWIPFNACDSGQAQWYRNTGRLSRWESSNRDRQGCGREWTGPLPCRHTRELQLVDRKFFCEGRRYVCEAASGEVLHSFCLVTPFPIVRSHKKQ